MQRVCQATLLPPHNLPQRTNAKQKKRPDVVAQEEVATIFITYLFKAKPQL